MSFNDKKYPLMTGSAFLLRIKTSCERKNEKKDSLQDKP